MGQLELHAEHSVRPEGWLWLLAMLADYRSDVKRPVAARGLILKTAVTYARLYIKGSNSPPQNQTFITSQQNFHSLHLTLVPFPASSPPPFWPTQIFRKHFAIKHKGIIWISFIRKRRGAEFGGNTVNSVAAVSDRCYLGEAKDFNFFLWSPKIINPLIYKSIPNTCSFWAQSPGAS